MTFLKSIKPTNPKRALKEYVIFTFGMLCYSIAWNVFILPQGFVGGGFGGIGSLIYYLTGGTDGGIPVGVSYFVMNAILLVIALRILGPDFSIKTVYGIVVLSAFLAFLPVLKTPIVQDKLLSAIIAGIIAGFGAGTYLLQGGSTGGSDIIVKIVSKYKNISWGKVYFAFDACVIGASYLLPERTLETVIYGYVFMGVHAYVVDLTHSGLRQSVQMFIFSKKYKEIADYLIHVQRRGATIFPTMGWYTKVSQHTVYLIARKRETALIYRHIKEIDEKAFIVVSSAMSVFGTGFEPIKGGFELTKKGVTVGADAKSHLLSVELKKPVIPPNVELTHRPLSMPAAVNNSQTETSI